MSRVFEVGLAVTGLVVLLPLLAAAALIVKLHDGGPVLFRGIRVGRNGKLFSLYKFRTMVPDAEKTGAAITASGDQRITPVGRRLRRYKIDELPQLINVLKGEMSFVGARPEDPAYVSLYDDRQREILAYKPGITGPASLAFRDEESLLTGADWQQKYIREVLPRKLALDISYMRRRTFFTDMRIILRTLGGIL
jgi:lipopolysaccharide/colanic/teichoic acid biosynthesis glycosyltransferase